MNEKDKKEEEKKDLKMCLNLMLVPFVDFW
jgi:hypothetical protein